MGVGSLWNIRLLEGRTARRSTSTLLFDAVPGRTGEPGQRLTYPCRGNVFRATSLCGVQSSHFAGSDGSALHEDHGSTLDRRYMTAKAKEADDYLDRRRKLGQKGGTGALKDPAADAPAPKPKPKPKGKGKGDHTETPSA